VDRKGNFMYLENMYSFLTLKKKKLGVATEPKTAVNSLSKGCFMMDLTNE